MTGASYHPRLFDNPVGSQASTEDSVDDPAPSGVEPRLSAVGQDLVAVAPGLFEGVSQDGDPVEATGLVDGSRGG